MKAQERAQQALAGLLKELFLLPMRLEDEASLVFFSNIIIDQVEKSFAELQILMGEDEE